MCMEEQSSKRMKKLTNIDWNKLLDCDDAPPSLVVTSAVGDTSTSTTGNSESIRSEVELMSDSKLEESIKKYKGYESLANKLPDGGQKIRDTIRGFEEEKERRERHRRTVKDDSRVETAIQSPTSSIKGTTIGSNQVTPSTRPPFSSIFCQKFMENQPNRVSDACGNQLSALGRCDRWKTGSSSHVISKDKCSSELGSKHTALQSPGCLGYGEKHVSNGVIRSSTSSTDIVEDQSHSSSRRNLSVVKRSYNLRRTNVQTVVLVDEEEYQHVDKVDEEEKRDESMTEIRIYFPSREHPEAVEICSADIGCLAPETCVSSTIINFYIRYLQQSACTTNNNKSSYHFFITYFYEKLKEAVQNKTNDMKEMFAKFRRWWKGVNIFEKAYIFLPIHEYHHWSLVIICIPDMEDESGPILLHYDSLGLHCSRSIFENVKRFLKKEWTYLNEKETSTNYPIADRIWQNLPRRINEEVITVPKQENEYDCGLFVLFFMQRCIENAPQRLKKKDLAMFGKQLFNPKEASDLRPYIRGLLKKLFLESSEGRSIE